LRTSVREKLPDDGWTATALNESAGSVAEPLRPHQASPRKGWFRAALTRASGRQLGERLAKMLLASAILEQKAPRFGSVAKYLLTVGKK
jgi:hypothetical protein